MQERVAVLVDQIDDQTRDEAEEDASDVCQHRPHAGVTRRDWRLHLSAVCRSLSAVCRSGLTHRRWRRGRRGVRLRRWIILSGWVLRDFTHHIPLVRSSAQDAPYEKIYCSEPIEVECLSIHSDGVSLRSDEVNQLFDTGQQCRLEVGIGANGRQDALPRVRDVGLGLMRPAQLGDDPMFPGLTTGNDRPALEPEAFRSHGLPHIDIRVAQDPDVRREVAQRSGLLNQLGLLGPGDEVVDENPEATTRDWCEVTNDGSEIVDTVKHLDHYPLDPQVVAPDLLDQLGVVLALDEDA